MHAVRNAVRIWGVVRMDMNTRTFFVPSSIVVLLAGNTTLPEAYLEFVEGQRDRKCAHPEDAFAGL